MLLHADHSGPGSRAHRLEATEPTVDLYWIPLGAGGHSVRFNGRLYELVAATAQHRPRRDLYHAALIVTVAQERYAIEIAPSPDAKERARGVVATGPVGSRRLRWFRLFRYEVRCCQNGRIPDLGFAVGGARRVATGAAIARQVLDVVPQVPTPVWGRDDLGAGEMWNSNSMVAWVLAEAGIDTAALRPPPGGRAPGWDAGLTVAARRRGWCGGPHRGPRHGADTGARTAPLHGCTALRPGSRWRSWSD